MIGGASRDARGTVRFQPCGPFVNLPREAMWPVTSTYSGM